MDEPAIRQFMTRAWHEAASARTAYWARRFADDRRATWAAAQALLDHMRRIRPEFPADRDRDADFSDHVKLRSCLECAAHAFARR